MRTLTEITANIALISNTQRGIEAQIALLDNEYQKIAIEKNGEPYEGWTEMRGKLQIALDSLNQLWHLEADLELDLKQSEIDDEKSDRIFNPDMEFHFRCDE